MAMAMMQPPGEPEVATKQDVQAVRQDVQRVEQKLEHVEQKVERVEQRVEGVEKDLQRVEKNVQRIEMDVQRVDEKVDAVFNVMNDHMASKSDVEHMGRIMTIWVVGAITALMGIVLATVWNMTQAILSLAR